MAEKTNLEKAVEYLKNNETVCIERYKDNFIITTDKERVAIFEKENDNG